LRHIFSHPYAWLPLRIKRLLLHRELLAISVAHHFAEWRVLGPAATVRMVRAIRTVLTLAANSENPKRYLRNQFPHQADDKADDAALGAAVWSAG
jgi:hypothetical protein